MGDWQFDTKQIVPGIQYLLQ